jgi:hypothetical protein
MKTWKTLSVAIAMLTVGAFSSLPFTVAEEGHDIDQMISTAKTPADHEAIAAYYDKEAQEASQKQAEHKKMEEVYKKNPSLIKSNFSFHCDQIAANYGKTAKEYQDLAKLHREMAQSAK